MAIPLSTSVLDQLFLAARTHHAWLDRTIDDQILRSLYDLMRMGPTSANGSPARLVFVKSPEAKKELLKAVSAGNQATTRAAPVTVIVGHDLEFYEKLPSLYPQTDARSWFAGQPALIEQTAFRNAALQGAYLIMAARALGLDVGPMSGFDAAAVDAVFFTGTTIKANFLINLGYGDPAGIRPRNPRLSFEEAARIV